MAADRAFEKWVSHRRFFKTKNGFFGLGPGNLHEGDRVWVVRGAHTPLVLRQVAEEETFRFVGDCYLHGCMEGEMLDEKWGLESKFRRVTLV